MNRIAHVSCAAHVLIFALLAIAIAAVITFVPGNTVSIGYADELSDAKEELAEKVDRLDELAAQIEELSAQIDEKASAAIELEERIQEKQKLIGEITVFFYKNPTARLIDYILTSENISQMISRAEIIYDYTDELAQMTKEERELDAQLHSEIDSISAQKDEQVSAQEELQSVVDELEARVDELTAEQLKRVTVGSTFATNFEDGVGSWQSGKASAYGGPDDSAGSITAMGTNINYTPAIAVPMSWPNYRSYFGKKIEISYNGKSVIGEVTDCGGFGKYGRDLDISYTVIRAWGFNSTNAWGVRTVKYRFL